MLPCVISLSKGPPRQPPALAPAQPSTAILKSSLRKLCDDIIWTEGLWLSCHSHCGLGEEAICGGLNNARSRLQTCIRLAIDAGAGLVLPTVMTRSETTLGPHDGSDEVCAGQFWTNDISTGPFDSLLALKIPQQLMLKRGHGQRLDRGSSTEMRGSVCLWENFPAGGANSGLTHTLQQYLKILSAVRNSAAVPEK